jgi:MoaA/NifB/PqqE/SkfB family radical SAM enzyme
MKRRVDYINALLPPDAEVVSRRPSFRSPLGKLPKMLRQFIDIRSAREAGNAPCSLPLLSIETTTDCNARCGMCGYPTDYPAAGPQMNTDELMQLIDEAAALGTLIISLGGGEPFMRKDTEQLIRHIDKHRISSLVHSNGSLLTTERCVRLADNAHLVLAMSLDSPRRSEHDSLRGVACFDRIVAASSYFAHHARQVRTILTCTITGQNYRDLIGVMRLAHDIGVRTVRFTPVHHNLQHRFRNASDFAPFALPEHALAELAEELETVIAFARRHRMMTNSRTFLRAIPSYFRGRVPHECYAGFFFCSVDPFGKLFPCYDHQSDINVRSKGGLTAAFHSPAMDVLRQKVLHCQQRCWNIGTAEPSLRMDLTQLASHSAQLLRESWLMLR